MRLLNAEEAHREAPRTFSIPRRAVREHLASGDLVKLLFVVEPPVDGVGVERMWVEVTNRDQRTGAYRGRLASTPRALADLNLGDAVDFGPEHVAGRDAPPGDPLYRDETSFAVVSRLVWDDDTWPSRLERHAMPDQSFSGWFVLAGSESPEFRADSANLLPIRHDTLFERFPVLDSGLEGPAGTVMGWDSEELEYRVIDSDPGATDLAPSTGDPASP